MVPSAAMAVSPERVLLAVLTASVLGCAPAGPAENRQQLSEVLLDYGPILRNVDARSARFLFHAARSLRRSTVNVCAPLDSPQAPACRP